MSEVRDDLIDIYAYEKRLAECSYELMGKMLDPVAVEKGINFLNVPKIYIYGGGYLGIQLYRVSADLINVPAIVDKKGKLAFCIPDIPVISDKRLEAIYQGEKIVVASIQYYDEIKRELSRYVDPDHIIYLGEVFGRLIS